MSNLKIIVPDTLVSFLLVTLSFCVFFFLAMLLVGQVILKRRSEQIIEGDLVSLTDQNIWYTVHET
jgi:hypothetical protein